VFFKSGAEFLKNPLNIALSFGGERLSAKLVDSGFGMQWHICKVLNERKPRR
jgi:hypothetical protein